MSILDLTKYTVPVLASYKGPAEDPLHQFSHWGIKLVTKGPYSHNEIILPFDELGMRTELSYSSSLRDQGVRAKMIEYDDKRWDFLELPWVNPEDVIERYNKTAGNPYDFFGLASHLLPYIKPHPEKEWCCEWIGRAVGLNTPEWFTPSTLHYVCRRKTEQWNEENDLEFTETDYPIY